MQFDHGVDAIGQGIECARQACRVGAGLDVAGGMGMGHPLELDNDPVQAGAHGPECLAQRAVCVGKRRYGCIEPAVGQLRQRLRHGSHDMGLPGGERVDGTGDPREIAAAFACVEGRVEIAARVGLRQIDDILAQTLQAFEQAVQRPGRAAQFGGQGGRVGATSEVPRDGGVQDLLELLVDPADERCFVLLDLPTRLDHEHFHGSSKKIRLNW